MKRCSSKTPCPQALGRARIQTLGKFMRPATRPPYFLRCGKWNIPAHSREETMQPMRRALCAALLSSVLLTPALAAGSGYHVLKSITLGGDGGFDYLNMDPATGYLRITRGSHLMVVDADTGKVVKD